VLEVWRKTKKVPLEKVKTLVAAYFNPMHNAPLRKIGVELIRDDEGQVKLKSCKADPKARRPERGNKKKTARRKAVRKPSLPRKPHSEKRQVTAPAHIPAAGAATASETKGESSGATG